MCNNLASSNRVSSFVKERSQGRYGAVPVTCSIHVLITAVLDGGQPGRLQFSLYSHHGDADVMRNLPIDYPAEDGHNIARILISESHSLTTRRVLCGPAAMFKSIGDPADLLRCLTSLGAGSYLMSYLQFAKPGKGF